MPGKAKNKLTKEERELRYKNIEIEWIRENLKEIIKGEVDYEAILYMAVVLDYVLAELIDVSNEIAHQKNPSSSVIEGEDIKDALDGDLELQELFNDLYDSTELL
ncbi:hypothetical protein NPIL_555511 [Nephila pilipes]|uniref:Histone H2A n=1 Tax=Nephila pilipes TaxID=299642 RepID=A0A8X6PDF2_NEPPI|nr:hypothetical protein NPIL_555511 [Nephila pilipes]